MGCQLSTETTAGRLHDFDLINNTGSLPKTNNKKTPCPNCDGCGGFDIMSKPTGIKSVNFKDVCNLCDGAGVLVDSSFSPCQQCETLGGFDCWGVPCRFVSLHYQNECTCCKGKGFIRQPLRVLTLHSCSDPISSFTSSGAITGFLLETNKARQ